MKNYIEYIEESLKNIKDNQMSYSYKKKLFDEMTERANEVTHAGLKNEKVIADLIADEYPDLEKNYYIYEKAEKKKATDKFLRIIMAIGGVLFFITIFAAFFAIGGKTDIWHPTWLIIVGGIFAMIVFYTFFLIKRICKLRRIFHIIARVLLGGCVMLISVFAFLLVLFVFDPGFSWTIVIGGVGVMLIADLIFAFATKQKFRTVSLFVYMPVITTMLYIILAGCSVITWIAGWPLIFLGLVIDLIIALTIAASNAKYFMYKQEDEE